MSDMSLKWRQIKYKIKHGYLSIENIVLVIAVVMCLVWTYQAVVSMSRNWELSDRLNSERKSLELLEVEVEMAELENEYYKSEEYQELSARKLAGKQAAGEHMVYLPENSEEAKNKHKEVAEATKEEPKDYSNIEKWMMYLLP